MSLCRRNNQGVFCVCLIIANKEVGVILSDI